MTIGYTTGVYDLFHIGHLKLLKRAKENCDFLVVGVSTDELSESAKGRKPIIPWADRAGIVAAIRYVDRVIPQVTLDKRKAWDEIHFDRMFVGSDWRGSERWNRLEDEFAKLNVEIYYFPYTERVSTSTIRNGLTLKS